VVVGYDPATGKPKRVTVYGDTRKEVQEKVLALSNERQQGGFLNPEQVTLGEWLDRWPNDYMRPPRVRQTTWEQYEYAARCHIKPVLGGIKLRKLLPAYIQKLYRTKIEEGRSPQTVKIMHVVLHESLDQAVKEGLILRNPTEATTPPRVTRPEIRVLQEEEMTRLLEIAARTRLYAAVLVLLGTGLRRGEVLGLKWSDVDLEAGTLTVNRSLVHTRRGPAEHEPKTAKGRRTVPIPGEALKALKAWRIRQAEERLRLGSGYRNEGWVFATKIGTPVYPKNFHRYFKWLLAKAGLPEDITIHTLRHTYATMLLKAGEHPKVVQELLGHASIVMTLDTYTHMVPGLKERAAETVNAILKEKLPSQLKGAAHREKDS
jgi:integrase